MRAAPAFALVALAFSAVAFGCTSSSSSASTSSSSSSSSGATVCPSDPVKPYEAGMSVKGIAGRIDVAIMDAQPAPPGRGNNTWTIALKDGSGKALDGLTVTAKSCMPKHGHCATVVPTITPKGGGLYDLTPLDLYMPGYWQITIATTGAVTDQAVFDFCVEG